MSKKQYSEEQKLEAVRLINVAGLTLNEVSKELGMSKDALYKWQKELGAKISTNQKIHSETIEWKEYHQLKQELFKERQKVEVLKKAILYFAKD
jgi:transposase